MASLLLPGLASNLGRHLSEDEELGVPVTPADRVCSRSIYAWVSAPLTPQVSATR